MGGCHKWLKCVYGIHSNAKLYGPKTLPKERTDTKCIALLAWFHAILRAADKMPDTHDYVLPAPSKKGVYGWYKADQEEYPEIYYLLSLAYFNTVWRTHFPTVKLRKYLRFHKCSICVQLRAVRWDRDSSRTEKADAAEKLRKHYNYIKQERAFARTKANHAICDPANAISIAMAGARIWRMAFHTSQSSARMMALK